MPIISSKRVWTKKPDYPVPLNLPIRTINKGLAHCWPMWEHGGTTVKDIVGGIDGAHDGTNPPNIIITEEGRVLNAELGDVGQINITGAPTFSGNYTCEFLIRHNQGTAYATVAVEGGSQGFWTTNGNLVFYDGADRAASSITDDEWTHVVAAFTANGANEDLQFYTNGKVAGSATNINGSFKPNYFLRHGSEPFDGDLVFFKIYNGVTKTAAEARSLYENTWQAFKPRTQYIDITVAAAPTGRIMSSLANHGGLAGYGGIAGIGGGLAG